MVRSQRAEEAIPEASISPQQAVVVDVTTGLSELLTSGGTWLDVAKGLSFDLDHNTPSSFTSQRSGRQPVVPTGGSRVAREVRKAALEGRYHYSEESFIS